MTQTNPPRKSQKSIGRTWLEWKTAACVPPSSASTRASTVPSSPKQTRPCRRRDSMNCVARRGDAPLNRAEAEHDGRRHDRNGTDQYFGNRGPIGSAKLAEQEPPPKDSNQ